MKGKTALITGSTDGVGRYVAERLAAEGAYVFIHGRDRARGEAVLDRITRQGGDARLLMADLSSLDGVRSLAEAVKRDAGRLDTLVNNAGIGTGRATRPQRRRLRTAVRGQLPCRVSLDAPFAPDA
jgi:NAD(P)-dependent dehydrogenase (short-subunit alcohol dehydrogenase family)